MSDFRPTDEDLPLVESFLSALKGLLVHCADRAAPAFLAAEASAAVFRKMDVRRLGAIAAHCGDENSTVEAWVRTFRVRLRGGEGRPEDRTRSWRKLASDYLTAFTENRDIIEAELARQK